MWESEIGIKNMDKNTRSTKKKRQNFQHYSEADKKLFNAKIKKEKLEKKVSNVKKRKLLPDNEDEVLVEQKLKKREKQKDDIQLSEEKPNNRPPRAARPKGFNFG